VTQDKLTEQPVAITREFFWVGFIGKGTRLSCNPYLLLDEGGEAVFFDPGSIPDFPVVMRKVIEVIPPKHISTIVVSHQDPDVCGNLAVVEDVIDREDLKIVGHSNTLRLMDHLGLKSGLYAIDAHDYRLQLTSGRILEFIHLPFLHAAGAIATFDRASRTLLSGDLFASLEGAASIFDNAKFPHSMDRFHQTYMPSNAILQRGLKSLEPLDIDRILPQHGGVIGGDQIAVAFKHLRQLPCGADLMKDD